MQHEESSFPHDYCRHEIDLSFLRPAPPSIRLESQSHTDSDLDTNSTVPRSGEADDEYTISAYGDISLSEVMVPSLLPPTRPNADVFQSANPYPRLRLKVQRPPTPKRRPSYNYITDSLARSGSMDFDERWPGSPRPIKNVSSLIRVVSFCCSPTSQDQSWLQHQPLVSPLSIDSPNPHTQGSKSTRNGGASLERLVDELLPHSPSIRLSPPGSPASQAIGLPQEGQKGGIKKDRLRVNDVQAKQSRYKPVPTSAPAPLQEKPWRTRLPPRPPIPKWDM